MKVRTCLQNVDSSGATFPKFVVVGKQLRGDFSGHSPPQKNFFYLLQVGVTCLEDECRINLERPSCSPALLKIYEAGFLRGEGGLSISNVSLGGRTM